jgi:4-hydroxy-3-methylbut-2-enyl diphosphate reductase
MVNIITKKQELLFHIQKNLRLTEEQKQAFYFRFSDRCGENFNPDKDLKRIGVVNQTTMLAGETVEITEFFKKVMEQEFGLDNIKHHIADTKDTLCYATSENQEAIGHLVKDTADFAIVVGGYNSSNTTHLAKLCKRVLPTYHIKDAQEIASKEQIKHLDLETLQVVTTENWLVQNSVDTITCLLSAGASSPDALVDEVIIRLCEIFGVKDLLPDAVEQCAKNNFGSNFAKSSLSLVS